jgi:hypothetical protein
MRIRDNAWCVLVARRRKVKPKRNVRDRCAAQVFAWLRCGEATPR